MKYKVGDKVRIRKDLKVGRYNDCYCSQEMVSHAGKVVTLVEKVELYDDRFRLKERLYGCSPSFHWSVSMFEGLAEEEPTPKPKEDWSWEDLF